MALPLVWVYCRFNTYHYDCLRNYQYFIIYKRDQVRFTAYGLQLTAYSRPTAYGLHPTAHGLRLTAYGLRLTAYGSRLTALPDF